MNINIKQVWNVPNKPVFVALAWFVIGSFSGFLLGHSPEVPVACRAPMLRAHFMERLTASDIPEAATIMRCYCEQSLTSFEYSDPRASSSTESSSKAGEA